MFVSKAYEQMRRKAVTQFDSDLYKPETFGA
jgi:hypothetical protein